MRQLANKKSPGKTLTLKAVGELAKSLRVYARMKAAGYCQILDIWDEAAVAEVPERNRVKLYYFPAPEYAVPAPCSKPPVIICPGGAYLTIGLFPEGVPTALALNEQGYPAFVLIYRVANAARHPAPLDDLAQAVRVVEAMMSRTGCPFENYMVWGYSAGGHLAASFGTYWVGAPHYELPLPAMLMLAYPVISMGDVTHKTTRNMLLGSPYDAQEADLLSCDHQVTADYPPTFLWHSSEDSIVDIANSNRFDAALSKAGVTHDYRVVEADLHGWGLSRGTVADGWFEEALLFWERLQRGPAKPAVIQESCLPGKRA